jgi:hypothetical protein
MNQVPLLCDNESVIKFTYNPCEHYRTKHIDICHHFLRDHAIKGDIVISHVWTYEQLINIFTKPLDEKRFQELMNELNIINYRNVAWKVAHLKCFLSCLGLSLWVIENLLSYSYVNLIAYRFMLVFIMVISYQACLVRKIYFKILSAWSMCAKLWSIDQVIYSKNFWNNFQVWKSYSHRISPAHIGQVWSGVPLDKSGPFIGQVWCPGYITPWPAIDCPFGLLSSPNFSYRWLWWFLGDLEFPHHSLVDF